MVISMAKIFQPRVIRVLIVLEKSIFRSIAAKVQILIRWDVTSSDQTELLFFTSFWSSLRSTPDFESYSLSCRAFCLRQLSICTSSLVKRTYEFKTASSHAPYFIEVEYLKRSTHSKPHKPFLRRLLCPKNKISYAISYYRRLHQALEHPLTSRQGRSGKQAVRI